MSSSAPRYSTRDPARLLDARRRGWFPVVTAVLAVALLAGCGGAGDDARAARSSTTAPPATTAPVTTFAPPPDPYADLPLVESVTWVDAVDGPRLLVFPTEAGRRTTTESNGERAWQEVLAAAPDAATPGMRDQFICHWVWARLVRPDKPSWNLEPWRPAVGYAETVSATCNPGGPER